MEQVRRRTLRRLDEEQGVRHVYREGLTDANRDRFLTNIEYMKAFEQNLPSGDSGIELLLLDEYSQQTLLVGAAVRLLLAGEPIDFPAAEDEEA